MFKYHNISYSRRKFVVRNVIVQMVFRIVSAVTILGYLRYIMIFKYLGGIPNVAALVWQMLQVQYSCKHVLICCAFKMKQQDESLRYVSEPVVMYSTEYCNAEEKDFEL